MSNNDNQQSHHLEEIIEILDYLIDRPSLDLSADSVWDVMDIASNEELDSCCRRRLSTDELDGLRPKSFLHDEMDEFNQIFAELVEPKRRFLMKNLSLADVCEPDVDDILSSAVSTDNELDISQNGTLNCSDGIEQVVCNPVAANQLPSTLPTCSKYQLSSIAYHEDDNDSGYQSGTNTLVSTVNETSPLGLCSAESQSMWQTCIDQGFIRVQVNLNEPINMTLKSVNDFTHFNSTAIEMFYLPHDTIIVIHITSKMTTDEVIQTLLDKYAITNNCNKFALYEKTTINSTDFNGQRCVESVRRLGHDECPLKLWLRWTDDIDSHQFLLRDNVTSEIAWDAFSLPELEAFLQILDREEGSYISKVKRKFVSINAAAVQRLKQLNNLLNC